jgi:hypothetical protein
VRDKGVLTEGDGSGDETSLAPLEGLAPGPTLVPLLTEERGRLLHRLKDSELRALALGRWRATRSKRPSASSAAWRERWTSSCG